MDVLTPATAAPTQHTPRLHLHHVRKMPGGPGLRAEARRNLLPTTTASLRWVLLHAASRERYEPAQYSGSQMLFTIARSPQGEGTLSPSFLNYLPPDRHRREKHCRHRPPHNPQKNEAGGGGGGYFALFSPVCVSHLADGVPELVVLLLAHGEAVEVRAGAEQGPACRRATRSNPKGGRKRLTNAHDVNNKILRSLEYLTGRETTTFGTTDDRSHSGNFPGGVRTESTKQK